MDSIKQITERKNTQCIKLSRDSLQSIIGKQLIQIKKNKTVTLKDKLALYINK